MAYSARRQSVQTHARQFCVIRLARKGRPVPTEPDLIWRSPKLGEVAVALRSWCTDIRNYERAVAWLAEM